MGLSATFQSVEEMISLIAGCQATCNLYKQAQEALKTYNGHSLAVKIVSPEVVPFGALCQYALGEIWMSAALNGQQALSTLLFELANMIHAQRFHDVSIKALNKEITKEEFARLMEEIEYDSVHLHTNTIKEASLEQGPEWLLLDDYRSSALDANLYLSAQQQGGHTHYYYQWWDDHVV